MHEPGLPQVQKSPLGGVSPTPVPKAGVLPGIAWQAWTKFWAIGTPIAPWSKGLAPPDPATHVVFVGLHEEASPVSANYIVRQEIKVQGSFGYSNKDFEDALRLLSSAFGNGIGQAGSSPEIHFWQSFCWQKTDFFTRTAARLSFSWPQQPIESGATVIRY